VQIFDDSRSRPDWFIDMPIDNGWSVGTDYLNRFAFATCLLRIDSGA
jgi:hypothetical protein